MLQPDKLYSFVWDKVSHRPACPILQALYGGDREPCHVFPDWQINPVKTFVRITATGANILKQARIENDAKAVSQANSQDEPKPKDAAGA